MMSASEQTSASKRERGLYHVRMGNHWTVAEYTDHHGQWRVFNNTDQKQSHHFDEIGERIERTSPQQQPDTQIRLFQEVLEFINYHPPASHGPATELAKRFTIARVCQPDELSDLKVLRATYDDLEKRWREINELAKAQERIKQLESKIEYLEEKIKDREEWTDNWG